MRKSLIAAAALIAALGGPNAFANHLPGAQPSQHCDGTTPGSPPAKVKIDANVSGVCFNATGGFKGAVWMNISKGSIVFDGDSTNASTNKCFDGYVGVSADGDSHLVWSQGGNFDPNAASGDGGNTAAGSGSSNDSFDPQDERGEVTGCFVG